MIINSLQYNDQKYNFVKGSKTNKSKFTILVGKNGSGKSEIIRQVISTIIRVQLPSYRDSVYRDKLDDFLDNNYKNLLSQRESSLNIELSINIHDCEYCIKFKKTNEAREFKNHLGFIELINDNNYRYINSILQYPNVDNKCIKQNALGNINIIAVSTSPFDKFPMLQSMGNLKGENLSYSYLGASTNENSYSHIDNFIIKNMKVLCSSILKLIIENKNFDYKKVFQYLGFKEKLKIFYSLNHEAKKFNLESISKSENSPLVSSIGIEQEVIDKNEKQEILNAINFLTPKNERNSFNFNKIDDVSSVSINFNNDKYDELTQRLGLLSKHGLIDFHNVEFCSDSANILFSQASSGQLCILLNIFGIASRIEHDSLILIDEPELSLHPKWQEEFLPLVKSVFDNFKRCHFVIATHSPQIASSLNDEDSYILKIDDGTLLSSTDIFKNSIDYQLVNIFDAPGFSNDYVSKELIKILTQISQKGEISASLYERIKLVKNFKKLISSIDPLNKLYKLLDLAEGKYNDGV